jgi:hypothetical protein
MRYCPYCRRWSSGRPQRCFYCGRTWYIRLCRSSHENPPDAQFCGTCGSADLTDTAGPRPFLIWFIRIGVLAILVLFIITLSRSRFHFSEQFITYIIAIVLLIVGLSIALSFMPNPIRRPILAGLRALKRIGRQVISWLWEKFKLIFT